MAYKLKAYKPAVRPLRVERSEVLPDGRSRWYLEYRHDDPEHCRQFVNAVMTSYESWLSSLLRTKGFTSIPDTLLRVESLAEDIQLTARAGLWILIGGLITSVYPAISLGREAKRLYTRRKHHRRFLAVTLMLLFFNVGCASTERAWLLGEANAEREFQKRDNVVIAGVVSTEPIGKKYIENYLLGSMPARAKLKANVDFEIEKVINGKITDPEIKFYNLLANGESFFPMVGERYFVGFDGTASNPRNVIFVPIPKENEPDK